METAEFETDLSLFKYDSLEQLPPAYRTLEADERNERIVQAKAELGNDVVILGHNYQRREIIEHAALSSLIPPRPAFVRRAIGAV
jgi:quinolinate synthase